MIKYYLIFLLYFVYNFNLPTIDNLISNDDFLINVFIILFYYNLNIVASWLVEWVSDSTVAIQQPYSHFILSSFETVNTTASGHVLPELVVKDYYADDDTVFTVTDSLSGDKF